MTRIKTIECYKTADGKIFQRESEANSHADELVFAKAEDFINTLFPGAHRPSSLKAVEWLHANPQSARVKLRGLLTVLEYGEHEE